MEIDRTAPLYFPFTHVSDASVRAVCACFGKMAVLRPTAAPLCPPMAEWAEKGRLKPFLPHGEDDARVKGIVAGYREWGSFNPGVRREGYAAASGKTPFYDEDSTMGIRTELGRREKGEDTKQEADTLLNARVFLAMADGYDLENDAVDRELGRVSSLEKGLFEALRGEVEMPELRDPVRDDADPGEYMTAERLEAWSRLRESADGAGENRLLVTDSGAVTQRLMESSGPLETLLTVEGVPLEGPGDGEAVWALVEEAVKAPGRGDGIGRTLSDSKGGPEGGETVSLTLYRVPEGALSPLFPSGEGLLGVVAPGSGSGLANDPF